MKWTAEFKRSKDSTEDDLLSDHIKTSITDEQVDVIHPMVLDDRHLTDQQIAKSISMSSRLILYFNLDLGNEQALSKMDYKNADARAQVTFDSFPS